MHRKIPTPLAVVIIASVIAGVAWNAVRSAAQDQYIHSHVQNMDKNYCYKCHTDAKTLAAMKDKRGF